MARPQDVLTPLVQDWPVESVAVAVTDRNGIVAFGGRWPGPQPWDPLTWTSRLASLTKLFVAWATLVAFEEGTVSLDEPAGPPGSSVRHLLAHTSGHAFSTPELLADPGTRRIYSNVGIEALAAHVGARAEMSFGEYLQAAVFEPLGMTATQMQGSPAHGAWSPILDVLTFAREVMSPTLISPATRDMAVTPQFAELAGVLPGFGSQTPNPWGLGFEVRGQKSPHWTGSGNSPATHGHFGGAGTFLWIDPAVELACACITNREFGPWAAEAWPTFSDRVLQLNLGRANQDG